MSSVIPGTGAMVQRRRIDEEGRVDGWARRERVRAGRAGRGATSKSRRQRLAPGAAPDAHRCAALRCNTMSAAIESRPGREQPSQQGVVMANGGLATTRKGRRGSRRSAASARTTRTRAPEPATELLGARRVQFDRDDTRAGARTSAAVNAPVPAPTSSTSSPGRTPASATIVSAQCQRVGASPSRPAVRGHGSAP